MKILVACEFSGVVREAFRKKGHDAWSCDILPTEIIGNHIQGNVLEVLTEGWDLMIAHPPCTYLTNAGVRHLYSVPSRHGVLPKIHGEERWQLMRESAEFFNKLKTAPIDKICIENPVPHKHSRALIGKYDQIINPWQFGHGEIKKTCLWLKNLSPLIPTNIVEGRKNKLGNLSPSPDRAKLRSITYQGFADAMAEQWG